MFRKILLTALFASVAMPAFAGNGIYAGINGGYGGGKEAYSYTETYPLGFTTVSVDGKGQQKSSGFLGGAQIGFNDLISGNLLLGAEADFDASGIETDIAPVSGFESMRAGFATPKFGTRIEYLGTARARFGYSADNFLLYATGGLAYGDIKPRFDIDLTPAAPVPPPPYTSTLKSSARTGWTAGAGVELPIWGRFSFKAEYLYVDLGQYKFIDGAVPVSALFGYANGQLKSNVRTTANILRVGVNFALD